MKLRTTYFECQICHKECSWADTGELCWGQTICDDPSSDDEHHSCEGHRETLDWCCNRPGARKYIPKPI